MSTANYVRNTTLSDMLKAVEQSRNDRIYEKMHQAPLTRQIPQTSSASSKENDAKDMSTPLKTKEPIAAASEKITPAKTRAPNAAGGLEDSRADSIPFTLDELEWLDEAAEKHGHADISGVIRRLIDWANAESSEVKKKLFLVIRCRRCSAGAKGGVKRDREISLLGHHWQWLQNVKERANHASIGKTIRIIVDFYMPFCKQDAALEQKILRAGAAKKTDRHEDAVENVDPSRALTIKHWPAPSGYLTQN
eukprot:TRINITY_DN3078_c2_g1_i2.p1 TRINITY_DN3078_c2_g1~~TRINITY_DN3078_c2_g1_i2.p1  ORF type:complete len:250 (-),score=59.25 TRINITY_DN3078_c2_g1_i2:308-1057(-)